MKQKMRKCVAVLLIISLFASSIGLVSADTPATNGGQNSEGDWIYNKDNLNGENSYYYYCTGSSNVCWIFDNVVWA